MKLIRQPEGSLLCGQSTVAMVAGISLEESVKLYGHKNATRYSEHVKVMNKLGVTFKDWKKVDNRKKWQLPSFAIVRIQYGRRRRGHLMVYRNGKFYDPANGIFNSKEEMLNHYNSSIKTRIDWYVEVLGVEPKESLVAGS